MPGFSTKKTSYISAKISNKSDGKGKGKEKPQNNNYFAVLEELPDPEDMDANLEVSKGEVGVEDSMAGMSFQERECKGQAAVKPAHDVKPGEFYTILGATQITSETLKNLRKELSAFLLCHMVVIYKLFVKDGIDFASVCTITSQDDILYLRNEWRIPLFPHDGTGWPSYDTHFRQFHLENSVPFGVNRTLSKNSCLRWDNAFDIPVGILRPTIGKDKESCVSLSKGAYELWDKLMVENNIVEGSRYNPAWKTQEEEVKNPQRWAAMKEAKERAKKSKPKKKPQRYNSPKPSYNPRSQW